MMERDWIYFTLIGLGALLIWGVFRASGPGGIRTSMIACALAAGLAYAVLFNWIGPMP